jgi:hypothetical protein
VSELGQYIDLVDQVMTGSITRTGPLANADESAVVGALEEMSKVIDADQRTVTKVIMLWPIVHTLRQNLAWMECYADTLTVVDKDGTPTIAMTKDGLTAYLTIHWDPEVEGRLDDSTLTLP